jgi:phosphoglycolate phosphatase
MILPTPKAILFDWDNTLVDTWPIIHRALNETLRYMQHPEWSFEQVKGNVKKSMRESFPDMFKERWQEAAAHYQKSYKSLNITQLQPITDAEIMLQSARKAGLFLGVVSNKKGDTLRDEITHFGWDHYFDAIVGAGDAARDKPSCDPAKLALKNYAGAHDATIWFIGDTGVDLECAAALGATAILYGDHVPVGNFHDEQPFTMHVRDQKALKELVLKSIGAV